VLGPLDERERREFMDLGALLPGGEAEVVLPEGLNAG